MSEQKMKKIYTEANNQCKIKGLKSLELSVQNKLIETDFKYSSQHA